MLAMGYKPHVLKIAELCRPDHQTIMWVTSWQKNLKPLVEDLLDDYVEIKFGTTPLPVENSVEMTVDVCQEEEKIAKLAELLDDVLKTKTDRAVVFAERRLKVEEIAFQLRQCGWPAIGLHGKKDKKERDWVLSMFSSGAETVLVTTDVVVQDVDFGNVLVVVNYDCPDCAKVYGHRLRHAQLADEPGVVHTFVVPTQHRQAKALVEILEDAKQPVNPELYGMVKNICARRRTDRSSNLRGHSQHVCHVCAVYFSSAWDLQIHYATHRREVPHLCGECGAQFRERSQRDRHQLRHHLEAPSVCHGCHLTFPTRSLLLQHRCAAVVLPEPVYLCPVCGLCYEHRDILDKHVSFEHYQCSVCSHAFEHSSGLVAHLVRHALELT
ncbi:hypothetical protein MTO96_015739 [Rhipicephalus appendiculatus]